MRIQVTLATCPEAKFLVPYAGDKVNSGIGLKGQCHEIFASGFFHESVSPQPQSIPLGPVSATPVANFATSFASVVDTGGKIATGINDTGGKFAAGINDTGGNLPPVSTTPAANNGNNIRLLRP